jgi:lactate permease
LFDSLQRISAEQVGISANLMAAAKRCGGVMAKMIDAQSVVVGSTATERDGHGSNISRYVFFHSIALTALAGIMVTLQAYGFPFTHLVLQ